MQTGIDHNVRIVGSKENKNKHLWVFYSTTVDKKLLCGLYDGLLLLEVKIMYRFVFIKI